MGDSSMSKYNSKEIIIDGIRFPSRAEGNRYAELKLLLRAGVIRELTLQPKFELIAPFTHSGKKYKGARYTADFRYVENDRIVIEEVKGFRDKSYILRLKMFLTLNKNIDFREIK